MIVSFDVGIRNMAYCVLEKKEFQKENPRNLTIHKWGILNLAVPPSQTETETSMVVVAVVDPPVQKRKKKTSTDASKKKPKRAKTAADLDLITAGKHLALHLDQLFSLEDLRRITEIRIENQIGPIATRMKTIQGMLTMYFLMRMDFSHTPPPIKYISSRQKLNVPPPSPTDTISTLAPVKKRKRISDEAILDPSPTPAKPTYKDRKHHSIELCAAYLSSRVCSADWLDLFRSHAKKDDLADCFLQAIC